MKTLSCRKLTYPGMTEDDKVRRYVPPCRLVRSSLADHPELLVGELRVQSYVHFNPPTAILHPGGEVILDFGRELHGQLALTSAGMPHPLEARITFGESVSETLGTPTIDHAIHQLRLPIPPMGQIFLGNTAFRFVRIELPADAPCPLPLIGVAAEAIYRDWEYRGFFDSDDPRLNRIWEVGAYTVHLNCQDYIYDGVKRDRLVWMGDLYPEIRTLLAVFDETDLICKSLDFMRETTPRGYWMNGISSYSCWYLICQRDLYWYRGDYAYLRNRRDTIQAMLEQLAGCVDSHGCEQLGKIRFLDWSTADDDAVKHAGLQGLLAWTLRNGIELAELLELPVLARRCRLAEAKLHKLLPDCGGNKVAAAMQVLGNLADPEQTNNRIFRREPTRGISTFYGYFILLARAQAGDTAGAVDLIRKYWGGMLDFGATTFWEDFDLDWTENAYGIDSLPVSGKKDIHGDFGKHCYVGLRHSLCHGWAGGPTAFLSEHVLGIRPLSPGFREVRIAPELPGLSRVEGALPTPYGLIELSARTIGNRIRKTVKLPKEIRQL